MSVQQYFLGANSADGFFSCYDDFCPIEEEAFLWVIKGGPGCGKSSFMRKIGAAAEQRGLDVEYVLCSGDPESLDGVYIPQLHLAYTDGTAPHVQEVRYPAVRGAYLDLGQFYKREQLEPYADKIIAVNNNYKALYQKAYALLGQFSSRGGITPSQGKKRFYAAISCRGVVYCDLPWDGITVAEDELQEKLESVNRDDILYLHPLWPQRIVAAKQNGVVYKAELTIPDCGEAIKTLSEAKSLHDELESIYNPHVNFDAIYALAQEHIEKYL